MKKAVSYGGYLIVTAGGMAVSLFHVLPVENTVVFLLGLFWAWNSVSSCWDWDIRSGRPLSRPTGASGG